MGRESFDWIKLLYSQCSRCVDPAHHAERQLDRAGTAAWRGCLGLFRLEDEVENHWGELFKAALLSTLLSIGSEAGTGSRQNDLISAIRQGASNSISQIGSQIVGRQLNIQPTLTIRPGFPIRVIVNRDLELALYGQ